MADNILGLQELDREKLAIAGGKGANLGELCRIDGIRVPGGFCISTEAFKTVVGGAPAVNELLEELALLTIDDPAKITALSHTIREAIEGIAIPAAITKDIMRHLAKLGESNAYAIRSSATAEDLPTASFAGQQDTYLNIMGRQAMLQHISKCWASLFTERAVIYRLQNGFDHRNVSLAVVVQQMVFPQVAGILFTADPITGNRKVSSIDASFGLGEALVSGLVNSDNYKVRNGEIVEKKIPAKKLAIYASSNGGTEEQEIAAEKQVVQALADEQVLQLEDIGRKIEAHFGSPQDIEWCVANGVFYIVQSRPITTLFPLPDVNDDQPHVYISVGHQQMMTDAIKPLGLSIFRLMPSAPMYTAGGRLFVDIAKNLASPEGRHTLINVLGRSDLLVRDALTTIIERGDIVQTIPAENYDASTDKNAMRSTFQPLADNNPAVVGGLISRSEASLEALKDNIKTKHGAALFDFILEDFQQLRTILGDPKNMGAIMSGMTAAWWLNEKMEEWLGVKNAADSISQSVQGNITAEMGRELLDVADVIRPYPQVVEYLQHTKDDNFLDELTKLDGGQQARDAITAYLDKYGMRCAGEIDITRPRWSEKPVTLVPLVVGNIKNFEPGAAARKFEQGLQEAQNKEHSLLEELKQLPDGAQKAEETKRVIDTIRNFSGYREYPKYAIVNRFFIYKKALLKEAEQLVQSGIIRDKEDIYYLSLQELHEVVRTQALNYDVITVRKAAYKIFEKLTPPRVMTGDGEIITGKYKRGNLPGGAIVGLAVSSGVIEGRARVIFSMEDANLEKDDILITPFTDPSWTPLFVSIKGLVTEVGGLMTHGAVIAREYGLPAVVGVENATKLIKDGQRIRVNGTEGWIEIL